MAKNPLTMLQELNEYDGLSQLVSRFGDVMRARLWEKLAEGYAGWADNTPDMPRPELNGLSYIEFTRNKLIMSLNKYVAGEKAQLVDIANLAAILWIHECLEKAPVFTGTPTG